MNNNRRKSKNKMASGRKTKKPESKQKQVKRPEWNSEINDLNKYKLTEKEMVS